MVNLGNFLNEFAANLHVFPALVVGSVLGALIFGYFFNRIVGYYRQVNRSIFVVIGTIVTLGIMALFSWKSALLGLLAFTCTGLLMAVGDYQRGLAALAKSEPKPRIKRASYKINGLVDECAMSGEQASRYLAEALKKSDRAEQIGLIALAQNEISNLRLSVQDIRQIQKEG
jgi:sugar phosphate permease